MATGGAGDGMGGQVQQPESQVGARCNADTSRQPRDSQSSRLEIVPLDLGSEIAKRPCRTRIIQDSIPAFESSERAESYILQCEASSLQSAQSACLSAPSQRVLQKLQVHS